MSRQKKYSSEQRIYPRKLLMISAAFPPTGGPGVQRSAKFAKYLPQFGWNPHVWMVCDLPGLPRDSSLLTDLPSSVMLYEHAPPHNMARTFQRVVQDAAGRMGVPSRFSTALNWRLGAWVSRHSVPDDCIEWARDSVAPLLDLIRKERIDAIYSTFSPASNHWLAMTLKNETSLPWIADFRDLWIDDYRYVEPSAERRRIHRRMQQAFLEAADVVIGVTPRQTEILAHYVPDQSDKFLTITNGFDPEDFPSGDGANPNARLNTPSHSRLKTRNRFVLAHVGRLDKWRTGGSLLNGLKLLADQLGDAGSKFEFRAVGHVSEDTEKCVLATGIPCTFTGYVSHEQAINQMLDADALLLPLPDGPNSETVIAGKLFEYLAAGRPIVVVGPPDGECERIVRRLGAGLTVGYEPDAIAQAVYELFLMRHDRTPHQTCDADALESFSRVELTAELASALDGLIEKHSTKIGMSAKLLQPSGLTPTFLGRTQPVRVKSAVTPANQSPVASSSL